MLTKVQDLSIVFEATVQKTHQPTKSLDYIKIYIKVGLMALQSTACRMDVHTER